MAQNPDEGNPIPPAGGAEPPVSPPSGEEGQPLADALKQVLTRMDEQDQRIKGLQKGTDKQIGQVRSDVKRILELREQGLNENQIQRELFVDSLMLDQKPAPAEPGGKQAPAQPEFDVESALKAMQFEENDVALAALKIAYGADQMAMLKAAAQLRLDQLKTKPAGPAGALPPVGGQGAPQGNLQAEYETRRNAIVQNQALRGDAGTRALAELRVEMRQKGLSGV